MEEIRLDRVMALVWHRFVLVLMAAAAAALVYFVAPMYLASLPLTAGATVGRVPAASLEGAVGIAEPTDAQAPLQPAERRDVTALLEAATVRVSATGCSTKVTGSGFVVEQWLLTNSHIVGDAASLTLDQPSSPVPAPPTELPVTLRQPQIDLAGTALAEDAIAEEGLPIPEVALAWSETPAAVGQPVLLAGYGGGRQLSVMEAKVHAVVDGGAYGNDGQVLLLDQVIQAGFSGGPVVNRDGQVLGILRAYDSVTGLSIATPTAMMLDATRSSNNETQIGTCN